MKFKMIKNLNWIEEFKRKQEIKASNRKFLRENKLIPICKSFVYETERISERLTSLDETFINLYDDILKLNKIISHQKGRITKQTREQNKEKDETNIALSNIRAEIFNLKIKLRNQKILKL